MLRPKPLIAFHSVFCGVFDKLVGKRFSIVSSGLIRYVLKLAQASATQSGTA